MQANRTISHIRHGTKEEITIIRLSQAVKMTMQALPVNQFKDLVYMCIEMTEQSW